MLASLLLTRRFIELRSSGFPAAEPSLLPLKCNRSSVVGIYSCQVGWVNLVPT